MSMSNPQSPGDWVSKAHTRKLVTWEFPMDENQTWAIPSWPPKQGPDCDWEKSPHHTKTDPMPVVDTSDPVKKPTHYRHAKIEAIEYIKATLGEGYQYFLEGNVKKYMHRFRYKNGIEDLEKAKTYLQWLIEEMKERDTR